MEQKIIFRERLTELKELADSKENILTKSEIQEFFRETPLEASHFELIYEYLKSQHIQIADTEEEAEEARGSENPGSLSFYLSDLEKISGKVFQVMQEGDALLPPEEELALFGKLAAGDVEAKDRLIELYLPVVCGIAEDYKGSDIPVEDLIQEGNIGLLTALGSFGKMDSLAAYQACLLNGINQAMEEAIHAGKDYHEMGEQIAERVNHLNEAVKNLEEDLGHKVSVEELSAYLEMPAEEIRDVLRMAGDEIDIEKDGR